MTNATKNRMRPHFRCGDLVRSGANKYRVIEVGADGVPDLVRHEESGFAYHRKTSLGGWDDTFQLVHREVDARVLDLVNDYHTDLGGAK